ncbi:MAG: hypothetical protein J0J15_38115 [Mesorhizobium sp.]|nr:hypothetical protein [Mesorhizobium sp.]
MSLMFGRILPFFLCAPLLVSGGCSRSYDGTVEIPRQLDARRIWDKEPPQAGQPHNEAGVFPVSPQEANSVPRRRQAMRPHAPRLTRFSSPPASPGSGKPLACKDVTEPGKRYRMV